MARRNRSSQLKREREQKKRERQRKKSDRAAMKREKRFGKDEPMEGDGPDPHTEVTDIGLDTSAEPGES